MWLILFESLFNLEFIDFDFISKWKRKVHIVLVSHVKLVPLGISDFHDTRHSLHDELSQRVHEVESALQSSQLLTLLPRNRTIVCPIRRNSSAFCSSELLVLAFRPLQSNFGHFVKYSCDLTSYDRFIFEKCAIVWWWYVGWPFLNKWPISISRQRALNPPTRETRVHFIDLICDTRTTLLHVPRIPTFKQHSAWEYHMESHNAMTIDRTSVILHWCQISSQLVWHLTCSSRRMSWRMGGHRARESRNLILFDLASWLETIMLRNSII